ncbi:MAG: hypothetical protein JXA69_05615, partial [Phycisphaerae bacterium]|nr:hypothetical protein [Phycisphaerae bacterium]
GGRSGRAVRADCPTSWWGACDDLKVGAAALEFAGRHYYLVRIPLPFEALADVISYRLIECDRGRTACAVIDKYDGEFGVVKIVTNSDRPRLRWEPFVP